MPFSLGLLYKFASSSFFLIKCHIFTHIIPPNTRPQRIIKKRVRYEKSNKTQQLRGTHVQQPKNIRHNYRFSHELHYFVGAGDLVWLMMNFESDWNFSGDFFWLFHILTRRQKEKGNMYDCVSMYIGAKPIKHAKFTEG